MLPDNYWGPLFVGGASAELPPVKKDPHDVKPKAVVRTKEGEPTLTFPNISEAAR